MNKLLILFAAISLMLLVTNCGKKESDPQAHSEVQYMDEEPSDFEKYTEKYLVMKEQLFEKVDNMEQIDKKEQFIKSWYLGDQVKSGANSLVKQYMNYRADKYRNEKGISLNVPTTKEEIDKENSEFAATNVIVNQENYDSLKAIYKTWSSSKIARFTDYREITKYPEYKSVVEDRNKGIELVSIKGTEALTYAEAGDMKKFEYKMNELEGETQKFIIEMNRKYPPRHFEEINKAVTTEIEIITILFALNYQNR